MATVSDLRNDGDSGSEVMEANISDVDSINNNSSLSCFKYPENSQSERGLSCSRSPNDTHLRKPKMDISQSSFFIFLLKNYNYLETRSVFADLLSVLDVDGDVLQGPVQTFTVL